MILSVDDGCASDVRVAEMCRRHAIECVFYWPVEWKSLAYDKGYKPLTYMEALAISEDFEIGGHTFTHRHLTTLTGEELIEEVVGSKLAMQRLFDQDIDMFCPPRGYVNDESLNLIKKHYRGYRLTKGEGLVHIHPNSGANNNMPWREYAKTIEVKEIWGHSWELDKFDLWDELEEYLRENISR